MKVLFTGLYALFNAANTFKTAVDGQFYPGYADQEDATFPYSVYNLIYDENDFDFSDDIEMIMLQIDVYSDSNSPNEALTIYEYLKTLFDDCSPTVTGYTVISFQRQQTRLTKDELQATWGLSVDYEVYLEKAR